MATLESNFLDQDKEKDNSHMDTNSPEQATDMQDVATSPEVLPLPDNTPCQVDKYIDFLAINKQGHLLMGSSNLTGRYWGGSLWYYDNVSWAPDVEKCRAGYETSSGVADGVFLDDDKTIVVGQDCGAVEFVTMCYEGEQRGMRNHCRVDEHIDAVHCVRLTSNKKSILTGSADRSIYLWDCETCGVVRKLTPAHSQQVTGLSPNPSNDQLFLSSGMDGNILLWDLRSPKPASCVYRDWDIKPECVEWFGGAGEGHYLVGLQNGEVALRSINNLNHSITSHQVLNRPLYRVAVNPKRLTQFAVCGNDSRVMVLDIMEDTLKLRYEDDRHKDFVRGLAWLDADTLVTCGWDTSVLVHMV